jgi:hypothetical protein
MPQQSKGLRITAWVLTGLLTALFVISAVAKLTNSQQVVEMFQKWGLQDKTTLIGIGELASALLFAIPQTHTIGLLLLSAYMGGAIATHMQNGEQYISAAVILVIVWITGYLRNPLLLRSSAR